LILFTVLTNAAAQIFLKKGMLAVGGFSLGYRSISDFAISTALNRFVLIGLVTFIVSTLSHLIVLSRVDLSYAYPFLSLAYVVVALYAYLVFGENLGATRIAGIALICFGTLIVAHS
jgi:drug/metabolite transporter (DMT)-like permease